MINGSCVFFWKLKLYFITTDDKLIKRYNDNTIKIRTPLEFLNDLEEKTDA